MTQRDMSSIQGGVQTANDALNFILPELNGVNIGDQRQLRQFLGDVLGKMLGPFIGDNFGEGFGTLASGLFGMFGGNNLFVNARGGMGALDYQDTAYITAQARKAHEEYTRLNAEARYAALYRTTHANASDADVRAAVKANMDKRGMHNIVSFVGNALGFDNAEKVAANMQSMTAEMMRRNRLMNGVRPVNNTDAAYIANNLFTGAWDDASKTFDQWLDYDSRSWGGFETSAVSRLASELTKTMSFSRGDDGRGGTGDLKNSVERFRKTVKDYAEALEPMKEIFGEDMDKIIATMQQMTGQSIGQMDKMRTMEMASRLSSSMALGAYGMQEILGITGVVKQSMGRMQNLGTWNAVSADMQAMQAADAIYGGTAPGYRTAAQWQQAGLENIVGTHNSRAAEHMAQAYALWAKRQGGNATFDSFRELVLSSGKDPRRAAWELAGSPTSTEMTAAWGSDAYREAIMSGDAGSLTMETMVRNRGDRMAIRAGLSTGFMDAVGASDSREARRIFNAARDVIRNNTDIVNLHGEDRVNAIAAATGADPREAARLAAAMNYMENDRPMSQWLDSQVQLGNMERMRRRRAERDASRDFMKELNQTYWKPGAGWSQLIDKNNNYSITERIDAMLSSYSNLPNREEFATAIGIAVDEAKDDRLRLRDSDNAEDKIAARSREFVNYAMSGEALNNAGFQAAWESYRRAKSKNDAEGMKTARRDMMLAKNLSPDLLKRVKDAYGDNADAALTTIYENSARGDTDMESIARSALFSKSLDALPAEHGEALRALYNKYKQSAKDVNHDGKIAFGESWNDFAETIKKEGDANDKALLPELQKLVAAAANDGVDWKTQLIDLLTQMFPVLSGLEVAVRTFINGKGGEQVDTTVGTIN